jgi:hypothetical protein
MGDHPYSTDMESTYENIIAVCRVCGCRNVFNRASDLCTFEPIAFKTVICQNPSCRNDFPIKGDLINPAHQTLLFDCHDLLSAKQYMHAVLSITQAYEVFFSHYLRIELLYRPFATEGSGDRPALNLLAEQLYEAVQTFTFQPMRSLFLALAVRPTRFRSLAESEAWIKIIPRSPRRVVKVSDEQIDAVGDPELRNQLRDLAIVQIDGLRNRVVHKDAYRPTRDEAQAALSDAERVLHGLTSLLRLDGDAVWYLSEAGR